MVVVRVLLIGHSYVRRARKYRFTQRMNAFRMWVGNVRLEFAYIYKGGTNYKFFNESMEYRNQILEHNPDVIFTILGGNAVASRGEPQSKIEDATREMRVFHAWLRSRFPQALLVPGEVEARYNWHRGLPEGHVGESYKQRRRAFNKAIVRMKDKDYTLRLGEALHDKERYYEADGIHFKEEGNRRFWEFIVDTLRFIIADQQW